MVTFSSVEKHSSTRRRGFIDADTDNKSSEAMRLYQPKTGQHAGQCLEDKV